MLTRAAVQTKQKQKMDSSKKPPYNKHILRSSQKDIEQSKTVTPRKIRPNLSKEEKVALNDLSNEMT